MYTTWKIERYAFANNTWSGTPDVLTTYQDPQVSSKVGDSVDTFSFKVHNFNNEFDNYFKVSDKILISRVVNSSTLAGSDLLVTGIIKALPNDESGTQDLIRVEGVNFSETLARALVFVDGNSLTIPNFIKQAINHVGAYNDNFKVTWHPDNPTVKTDGSAFPVVTERWYNKSLLKLIEKYSSKTATEDTNYYWYIDNDNRLVWRARQATVSNSFNVATDKYKSIKTKKDTKDVYNFVIMKGGTTPGGTAISTRVVNNVSMAKHGFKPYIIVSNAGYAKTLISGDLGVDATSSYPSSYPFTTTWVSSITSADAPSCTKDSTITINSNGEYNTAIKREAKFLLEEEATRFLDVRGKGKLMCEITFQAGKGWAIGDVINVTIPSIGKLNNPMRVSEAQYHTDTDTYTLIEDEGTI